MTNKIDPKVTACEIFLSAGQEKDPIVSLLQLLSKIDSSNASEVLQQYQMLRSGELKIAQIISAKKLTADQVKKLEKKITDEFGENTIFLYSIDEKIVSGFRLQIGDLLYDRSLEALLN